MIEWIQYIPHVNCTKVAKFVGQNFDGSTCVEEANNAPYVLDDLKVQPRQWLRKEDGIITVHDEKEST